mmetsp:Transcript_37601/g.98577  ORF Transcript_37601/g.98577 Transcript_37601/m.98577 type:complete len:277 (-) Transcript_37601:273-1103(-)
MFVGVRGLLVEAFVCRALATLSRALTSASFELTCAAGGAACLPAAARRAASFRARSSRISRTLSSLRFQSGVSEPIELVDTVESCCNGAVRAAVDFSGESSCGGEPVGGGGGGVLSRISESPSELSSETNRDAARMASSSFFSTRARARSMRCSRSDSFSFRVLSASSALTLALTSASILALTSASCWAFIWICCRVVAAARSCFALSSFALIARRRCSSTSFRRASVSARRRSCSSSCTRLCSARSARSASASAARRSRSAFCSASVAASAAIAS